MRKTALANTNQPATLTVVECRAQLAVVVDRIHKAQGLHEIEAIRDMQAQTEAFLKTRAAAVAMGDQLDQLQREVRNIRALADIRQGELTRALPEVERARMLADHGISNTFARMCEKAADVPKATRDVLLSVDDDRKTFGLAKVGELPARLHVKVCDLVLARGKGVAGAAREVRATTDLPRNRGQDKTRKPRCEYGMPNHVARLHRRIAESCQLQRAVTSCSAGVQTAANRMAYLPVEPFDTYRERLAPLLAAFESRLGDLRNAVSEVEKCARGLAANGGAQ